MWKRKRRSHRCQKVVWKGRIVNCKKESVPVKMPKRRPAMPKRRLEREKVKCELVNVSVDMPK